MRRLRRRIFSLSPCLPLSLSCSRASLFALLVLAVAAGPGFDGRLLAQEPARAPTAAPLTESKVVERVTVALDRSIKYIAGKQNPDGSWHTAQAANAVAMLSMLGRGHVPGRGPYSEKLELGKRNLIQRQTDAGFLGASMYEHGLSTLACAELYGMDPDPVLEQKLRKAVDLILKAQSPSGGWRYNPTPGDQDLSVTVMQIVALRAANNAEIEVPAQTIDKAVAYVKTCSAPTGGFGYQGPSAGAQTTAAGIISLQLLGKYDDPTVGPAIGFLNKLPVQWQTPSITYFYYFHYYAIQAQYQAGGNSWNEWHPRVRELLLEKQNADGSWDLPPGSAETEAVVGPNKIYSTAMASLILEIYMHFLPAYQR
jgi:hypothetical protein